MQIDHSFVTSTLPQAEVNGSWPLNPQFYTDSRLVTTGSVFVALGGAKVDGHDYIQESIDKGAAACIVAAHKKESLKNIFNKNSHICFVIVENTATALIELARAWRKSFTIPVIGITGSINKTSTKEMLAQVIQIAGISYVKSNGNQNTLIGLSMNILRMNALHKVAIFEMGISKPGEMHKLAQLVQPTTAIITHIGHSHCEGLGSLNDVAAEKRQIFSCFKESNIGIVNGDVPFLASISYNHPVIKFGTKTSNQIQARQIKIDDTATTFVLKLYEKRFTVILPSIHPSRVMAALASATAAHLIGVSDEHIVQGIQQPLDIPGRFQKLELAQNRGTIIHDAYNASPESMRAAITSFDKMNSTRPKIAVLGDMLELGINSSYWHRQIGRILRKAKSITHVILVGEQIKHALKTIPHTIHIQQAKNWQEACAILENELKLKDAFVLLKASRGIGLDNIVKQIVR
jgi:UDP-N-acetylmuramoyl-tripeptide--D-alanyl-D-alanine ligase